jgi:hypothetical protein
MQYALMIYAEPGYDDRLTELARDGLYAEYLALAADERCVAHSRLQSVETATCVRVDGGRTVMTDGPFADTKEVLGGVYVIEAENLDEAVAFAARIPASRLGGVVEVRPVVSP